jgi:hypothetical protein
MIQHWLFLNKLVIKYLAIKISKNCIIRRYSSSLYSIIVVAVGKTLCYKIAALAGKPNKNNNKAARKNR